MRGSHHALKPGFERIGKKLIKDFKDKKACLNVNFCRLQDIRRKLLEAENI